ncbi:flagellar hook-length control protein FliK, partial [Sulfuricurvum sp.]|uniref:flagellar hook-length control protein FliK n=1 Tax=Sulfuricurvum sp. TaxID=2025608 RepID=UPI0019B0D0A7
SMNKALGEALKSAAPEQFETLKGAKDLKTFLSSLFNDKLTSAKSDTLLLNILKNNSAFKTMGSLTDNLASLIEELKNSPDFMAKTVVLEKFFKNISTINPQSLQHQINNSGVFMESKLAQAIQKIPNLTQTLEQLHTLLSKNSTKGVKTLQEKISTLLSSPHLPNASLNSQSAVSLSNALKEIQSTLTTILAKTDPLYSKEVLELSQKLDQLTVVHEIKTSLSQLYGALLFSKAPQSNNLLDSIEKLLKNLDTPATEELKSFTQQLRDAIKERDSSKELSTLITKLSTFTNPKELVTETFLRESMSNDLKSNLLSLFEELKASKEPNASKMLEQVDKILTQIDYHQLTSYLGNANSIYFPFSWETLEWGSMAFKKTANQKFYCEINLKLKEYGEMNLMMGLYDNNQIEISVYTEKEELKSLLYEHIGTLRSALIDAELHLRSIRITRSDENIPNQPYEIEDDMDNRFEVKV